MFIPKLANVCSRLVVPCRTLSACSAIPVRKLFERLQSYLIAPRNSLRWTWESGDVVIWDNRAIEPYPLNKIGSPYWAMDQRVIDAGGPRIKRPKSRAAKAA
ncbi:TauD/TfdA family dioxygenase [Bradyrhizobium yuanmingense]|uniref:TauD/TfdA family dioxygenase n=1 Tax=Bradyrhizobium yuanmingense TaxID=108015 RepID=UPI003D2ECCBC